MSRDELIDKAAKALFEAWNKGCKFEDESKSVKTAHRVDAEATLEVFEAAYPKFYRDRDGDLWVEVGDRAFLLNYVSWGTVEEATREFGLAPVSPTEIGETE